MRKKKPVKPLHEGNWKPGQSGNPKGRPKGVKDKRKRTTAKIREEMVEWLGDLFNIQNLDRAKQEMTIKEYLSLGIAIAKIFIPREKEIDKNVSGQISTSYEVSFKDDFLKELGYKDETKKIDKEEDESEED